MNKFKFYFLVSFATLSLFSCRKDDIGITVEPPRDYTVQYKADNSLIEDYLNTHYITVKDNPGFVDDQDVVIAKIDKRQPPIMSYLNVSTYPKLLVRTVYLHNIDKGYNLYYLVLREGIGEYPTNTDNILASYKGEYLSKQTVSDITTIKTTFFEEVKFPQKMTDLSGLDLVTIGRDLIKGWKEVFPQFKSGRYIINPNGTVSHLDFGAGVMFLPSGLAYYKGGSNSIPAYSPLIFSFKLYDIQRLDHDNDGIIDFYEDINADRYLPYSRELVKDVAVADDTDGDRIPNFLDVDDDGDGTNTRLEITKDAGTNSGLSLYFPFDPIADNPFTIVNETEKKGIPRKFSGPLLDPKLPESSTNLPTPQDSDYTDPLRLRRHLDDKCKPPYQN